MRFDWVDVEGWNLLGVLVVGNDGLSIGTVADLGVGLVAVRVGPWSPWQRVSFCEKTDVGDGCVLGILRVSIVGIRTFSNLGMALVRVRVGPGAANRMISILLQSEYYVNLLALVLVHVDWVVMRRWCQRHRVDGHTPDRVARSQLSGLLGSWLLRSRCFRSRFLGSRSLGSGLFCSFRGWLARSFGSRGLRSRLLVRRRANMSGRGRRGLRRGRSLGMLRRSCCRWRRRRGSLGLFRLRIGSRDS
jgi:hypothetical protein